MSNTDNQSVKVEIINNVIVAMTYYLSSDVLEMLERVLTKNLVDVVIERINTLPMEMKDSIDNQNGYILQLFLSGSYGAVLCTVYATYHSFGKRKCMYRKESHEDQGQEL